jgi:hypothetical protein
MSDDRWGLGKLTAMGLALVMIGAVIIGLVVANWSGPVPMVMLPASVPETMQAPSNLQSRSAVPVTAREPVAAPPAIDEACNEYAAKEIGPLDESKKVSSRASYAICVRARGY